MPIADSLRWLGAGGDTIPCVAVERLGVRFVVWRCRLEYPIIFIHLYPCSWLMIRVIATVAPNVELNNSKYDMGDENGTLYFMQNSCWGGERSVLLGHRLVRRKLSAFNQKRLGSRGQSIARVCFYLMTSTLPLVSPWTDFKVFFIYIYFPLHKKISFH